MKRKLLITVLFVFVGLFGFASPAYAASASSQAIQHAPKGVVRPNFTATGGGCSASTSRGLGSGVSVALTPCISGSGTLFGWSVGPDGYASFTTPSSVSSLWTSCTITLKLWDATLNTNPESQNFNCLSDAKASVHGKHYTLSSYSGGNPCPRGLYTTIAFQGTFATTPFAFSASSPSQVIQC